MAKNNDKKKRLKKEQERRRLYNKENKVQKVISYEEYYKDIMQMDLTSTEWLENEDNQTKSKLLYVFDHLHINNILEIELKFMEALVSFIEQCEKLYSPLLVKNEKLKRRARDTIVNYYRSGFEINMSREISFLPLELRLYIYIELLKREIIKYHIVCILDRIMVTLNKMEELQVYENSLFITSWAEYLLFLTTEYKLQYIHLGYTGYKKSGKYSDILQSNRQHTGQNIMDARKATLDSAMLDGAKRLNQEFWYGLNGFSHEENINDIRAAELCVNLFCDYFEKIFLAASEFRTLSINYFHTGHSDKIKKFLQKHMLDQIDMKSYKNYYNMDDEKVITKEYEPQEHDFTSQRGSEVYSRYLYLYNKDFEKATTFFNADLPDKISQMEYYSIIETFIEKLSTSPNVYLPDIEKYIVSITTAMLNSDEWNMYLLNYFLHILRMVLKHLWVYDGQIDITQEFMEWKYMLLLKEDDIEYWGSGAPVKFFIVGKGALAITISKYHTPIITCPIIASLRTVNLDMLKEFLILNNYTANDVMSDSYGLYPANTEILSWRIYDKTLTENQKEIRKLGWNRILYHHIMLKLADEFQMLWIL